MRFRIFLLLLLLPVARLAAQTDFPGADDKWQHFRSDNFELYSRNREADSRELLHDLELLRAFFLETNKLTERRRVEVTVYYFRSEKDFRSYASETYGPNHKFAGFYVQGVDRAVIYLIPGQDAISTRQLIFHEYIHHLFRVTENSPPTWFNEGMAELFSTLLPKADTIEFGHPVPGRVWQARNESLLPLEQLFAVDHSSAVFRQGEHTGLFYAESWALLHYLYFGDSKIPAQKRKIFLGLVLANGFKDAADMRTVFRDVFGMDYPEMVRKLDNYLTGGRYTWGRMPLPKTAASSSYAMRPVARPEINLRLAELALRVNRSPLAKLALLRAVDSDPADTRPLELLGADALRDQDTQRARERWERAAEAGTQNAAIYRELGLMESRAWFSRFDVYFRLPADKAHQLQRYLLRSIEYNPEQSEAYEMLAWVEAFSPELSVKNVTMIQKKYPTLKRQAHTALALAFVRVRLGKPEEALEMLQGIETMQPDPWETYGIEATRAFIEGRPIKRENLGPARPADPNRPRIQPPKVKLPADRRFNQS
jgi:predicted negative regulator of RcsB-dependent stress response